MSVIFETPWIAAFTAIFAWWFLTGILLFIVKKVDQVNPKAHKIVAISLSPILLFGCAIYWTSLSKSNLEAIYWSFFGSLSIWAWFELAFLLGLMNGPNKEYYKKSSSKKDRFYQAWSAIAYSELILFTSLLVMTFLSFGAENKVGLWTYGILYCARVCAKLNLFLGVPNINSDFLPIPVKHLSSYFKVGNTSWFFPISITLISFCLFFWVDRICAPGINNTAVVGYTLLASLTALALVEHWFMVVSVKDAELWRWMLPKAANQEQRLTGKEKQFKSEKIHGL